MPLFSAQSIRGGRLACGFSYHQFGLDRMSVVQLGHGPVNALEQNFRRRASHFAQRLAHRGQARLLIGGTLDVVEADNGNIFGDATSRLAQRANRSHGGDIVEREESGEAFPRSQ